MKSAITVVTIGLLMTACGGPGDIAKKAKAFAGKGCACKTTECYNDVVRSWASWAESAQSGDAKITVDDKSTIEEAHDKLFKCAGPLSGGAVRKSAQPSDSKPKQDSSKADEKKAKADKEPTESK